MVDYNIAIPQQQLFQAPDIMQNFMRMQQMDQMGATARLRNAQAEQLRGAQQQTAAERAAAAEIDRTVNEGFASGLTPTELANKFAKAGNPAAAAKVVGYGETLNAGRTNDLKLIDAALSGYTYHGSRVQSGDEAYEYGAALRRDPILGPLMDRFGAKTPEEAGEKARADFLRDPDLYRKNTSMLSSEKLVEVTKPVYREGPGGATLRVDPNNPNRLIEADILEAGAPQPGAGAGRVDTYRTPNLAARQDTQRRLGLPVTVNDGGLGARAETGAPVNALAAGQRQQPAVGGNAMAAPVAAASPYGARVQPQAAPGVVGSREFAQRAKDAELALAVKKAGLEALAREQATATVRGETETKTRQETAGRVLQVLNDPVIDDLIAKSTSGSLQRNVAGKIGAFGTSTSGMENIGRLNTIQESLLFRLANGKLGGGFTDKDTDTIRGMLGRIADPDTPANVRVKTLQDVRAMMQSVATGENMTLAPAAGGKSRRATAQPAAAASPAAAKAPAIGAVDGGYRFKGGDPSKVDSWEKM